LAPREKTRIGAAFIYATRKAQERLNNSHKIRDDNFFSEQSAERSAAEEIIEGVLLAALYTDNTARNLRPFLFSWHLSALLYRLYTLSSFLTFNFILFY